MTQPTDDPALAKTLQKLIALARAQGGRCVLIHQPKKLKVDFVLPAPIFQVVAVDAAGQEAELPLTLPIVNHLEDDLLPTAGTALLILFDDSTGEPPSIQAEPQPFFTYYTRDKGGWK